MVMSLSWGSNTTAARQVSANMDRVIEHLACAVNNLIRFFHPLNAVSDAQTKQTDEDASEKLRRQLKTVLSLDECYTLATLILGKTRVASTIAESPQVVVRQGSVELVDGDELRDDDDEDGAPQQMELVPALADVFRFGFRAKTVLGPSKHIWDFINRATRKISPGD